MTDEQKGVFPMSKVEKKRLLIFASGFPKPGERGGRGAVRLALQSREGLLGEVEVIGIVTDHENGSVMTRAKQYDIPCVLFPRLVKQGVIKLSYNKLINTHHPDLVIFCGWDQPVFMCFCPTKTISVHRGLYLGDRAVSYYNVPEDVVKAWLLDGGTELATSLTINFVNGPTVDDGPRVVTFKIPVSIDRLEAGSAADHLFAAVREALREARRHYLHQVVYHVLLGVVSWDGMTNIVDGVRMFTEVTIPNSYRILTDPDQCPSPPYITAFEDCGYGTHSRTIHGDAY